MRSVPVVVQREEVIPVPDGVDAHRVGLAPPVPRSSIEHCCGWNCAPTLNRVIGISSFAVRQAYDAVVPAKGTLERTRGALRSADFRRLLWIRLASQFADGLFQVSLIASVVFSPSRARRLGSSRPR